MTGNKDGNDWKSGQSKSNPAELPDSQNLSSKPAARNSVSGKALAAGFDSRAFSWSKPEAGAYGSQLQSSVNMPFVSLKTGS